MGTSHVSDKPLTGGASRRHVQGAVASLCLTMLLSSLGTSIANVGLPTLADAFHASFQSVQWVVLAYLLAVTTCVVTVGRVGDMMGRRRLMLIGIATFTAASAACAAAPALWLLIAARALQGLGAAVMMALTIAFVGQAVPKERTGSAMGLLATTSAIGTALGPSLGGLLIALGGWRLLFAVTVPLGLISLELARRFLPKDANRTAGEDRGLDAIGTVLLAVTLAAYALAMTLGKGHFSSINAVLLLIAVAGGALFVLAESKVAEPLVNLAVFGNVELRSGFVMSLLVTTVAMATLVVGPFYLTGALHLEPGVVGLVMSAGPLVAALVGAPAGRLVDRVGSGRMTLVALAVAMLGAVGLATAPVAWGITGYVVPLALFTAGFAAFQAANNTAVMAGTPAAERGVIAGLLTLSRNLGLVTGASVMGAVYALSAQAQGAAAASASDVVAGMHTTFFVATALLAAATGVWAMSRRGAPQA